MARRLGHWAFVILWSLVLGNWAFSQHPLTDLSIHAFPWADRSRLQGSWVVVSATEGGTPTDQLNGAIYTFDGDMVRIASPNFSMDSHPYRLATSKNPKEIDIVLHGGPSGKSLRGIYQLNGDELTLCTANWRPVQDSRGHTIVEPGERPRAFDSRSGPVVVLKRQAKSH
jgi:uncharacterized protein (TIGR03067 family)